MKQRNGGTWSEAKFKSFVISGLRSQSVRWPPRSKCLQRASTRRGFFLCALCNNECPTYIPVKGKRKRNAVVDHIAPVVTPEHGWVSWDAFVDNLFCELDNLQAVCLDCHKSKTAEERKLRKGK